MLNSIYWTLTAQFYLLLLGLLDAWRGVLFIQMSIYVSVHRKILNKITGGRYTHEMIMMEQFGKN